MTIVDDAPAPAAFADPTTVALQPDAAVVLAVRDLSVAFGGIRAVDGVNFDLVQGEILGVVGPNGAGKTTMFDAISGFVTSTGQVRLDGQDIGPMSPESRSRARLGRSFQDARLFPSLTVFETLNLSLERHLRAQDPVSTALTLPWVRRAERASAATAAELIERMGLGAFRDKFISELSTGTRRIVDLACIMAHDPLVLLLDEPSSGIAQREAEALGPVLLDLRDETGVSIMLIEHDMPLLVSVSDRLLALETGAVLTAGDSASVLDDPRLVAAYLGSNEATVHRSGTGTTTPAPVPMGKTAPDVVPDNETTTSDPDRSRKRTPVKKAATKKAAAKKRTTKKAATKKRATPKKAAPKKAAPKKTTAKKAPATKRTTTKKAAPKKAAPKKAATKKAATKKAATKKAATKKAAAKKAPATKRTTTKKAAPKKAAPKKAATKKAATKKRAASTRK